MKYIQIINVRRMSFLSMLALVFIILKLTGLSATVAAWSWWWVLSPLWLPFALFLGVILAGAFILFLGAWCIDAYRAGTGYKEKQKAKRQAMVDRVMKKRD